MKDLLMEDLTPVQQKHVETCAHNSKVLYDWLGHEIMAQLKFITFREVRIKDGSHMYRIDLTNYSVDLSTDVGEWNLDYRLTEMDCSIISGKVIELIKGF